MMINKENLNIASFIEHTNLKPEATKKDIIKLCDEAKQYGFFGVCVNPVYIEEAKKQLKDSRCKVISVIGFPLGANLSINKAEEAKTVIKLGADEVDMVMAIGALKSGDTDYVLNDIKSVVASAGNQPVKVIIETALLNNEEKTLACKLVMESGASFIKTSTGFSTSGAKIEDVKLMKSAVGNKIGIKAAGGIKDFNFAKELIDAGATRIGASASIAIIGG